MKSIGTPAEEAAAAAIRQVAASNAAWIQEYLPIIRALSLVRDSFTTDDVWSFISEAPAEPRAMGALMSQAKREGYIEATPVTVKSDRIECHARPLRVWRSLLRARAA